MQEPLKKGESGKGIRSRWYPATLAKRIRNIDLIRERLSFECCDGFEVLKANIPREDSVFFIDPPYTAGGKRAGNRLYKHFELDHEELFSICSRLSGDFIMTYDNAKEVWDLAVKFGFQAKPIPMKNTHHAKMTELVIGRDLGWMTGIERVLEQKIAYTPISMSIRDHPRSRIMGSKMHNRFCLDFARWRVFNLFPLLGKTRLR